ncbi:type II secretion system F family protein [Methylobacillus flagellatus]|uniref:type II secretion system F family protein n=1 Tax=Methylobacillus flagellatus TaxID=405 RepID=UPI00148595FC|nr:type II secretion system F family protein [Methylobacillus flagellatus]
MLVILCAVYFALLSYRQSVVRNRLRDRILYGFSEEEQEAEADLSAGDYGLQGSARFYFHLRKFIATTQGRFTLLLVGGALGVIASLLLGKHDSMATYAVLSGGGLLLLCMFWLRNYRKNHDSMVKEELPNLLETVAAIMESGVAFESALNFVLQESDRRHPLYFELNIMNEAMLRGRRRNEALRLWAGRSRVEAVGDVASGLIQADQTGASLGGVMRHHAQALMRENEAETQRRAERLPIRMLLPMVSMILPAVFILAAGPSVIRIFQIIDEIIS